MSLRWKFNIEALAMCILKVRFALQVRICRATITMFRHMSYKTILHEENIMITFSKEELSLLRFYRDSNSAGIDCQQSPFCQKENDKFL